MTTNIARQPSGIPVGGQFATAAHAEADVNLRNHMDDEAFALRVHEMSSGYVRAMRAPLPIEGTQDYWEFGFNNEDDIKFFVVQPDDGESFSFVGYGIHVVTYPDDPSLAETDSAPPKCVLHVPSDQRRPATPDALAAAFRQAGQYIDPKWADEEDDTGEGVWSEVHTRLVADLGL